MTHRSDIGQPGVEARAEWSEPRMSSIDKCQVQPESIERLTSLMLAMFNSLGHSIKKKVKFDAFPSPLSCGNSLALRLRLQGGSSALQRSGDVNFII